MSVALGIQHEMRMLHIVTYDPPRSTAIFHVVINGTFFGKKIY
jgi:hypothetical protein